MPIWQLCANLLIPNCLRSNLSYSPSAALELYVKNPKNISSTITMPRLYATIVLPSGFTIEKESYLRLFNPNASFEKGNLVPDQIDAVNANITVSLMGYPNWATNFTWSSTNVSEICIQGQSWTCISYNSFEVWDNEVEIKVAYQSPCGDWYEVSEMFPIVH